MRGFAVFLVALLLLSPMAVAASPPAPPDYHAMAMMLRMQRDRLAQQAFDAEIQLRLDAATISDLKSQIAKRPPPIPDLKGQLK